MKAARAIRRFAEHPVTNLCAGLLLFVSGFVEAYGSFYDDLKEMNIGAHHGMMLFGAMSVLASIPDIIEGVRTGARYIEQRTDRRLNLQEANSKAPDKASVREAKMPGGSWSVELISDI